LVLCKLAADRTGGRFRSADVRGLYQAFNLPEPSVSGILSNLRSDHFLIKEGSGRDTSWAITPEGTAKAEEQLADIDENALMVEERSQSGSNFLHALHTILDPVFAPARWQAGIDRLLKSSEFDRNVFCMTRFPSTEGLPDPVQAVVDRLRGVANSHGLVLRLASDRALDDDVLGNIGAYMWGCRYGIGLLEDRRGRGLNYNVVTELGAMLITGRRCALLKDRSAPEIPTDLAGQIYKPLDFDEVDVVADEVHRWMANDLGLGACANCPSDGEPA
jgi:hypothetical protein